MNLHSNPKAPQSSPGGEHLDGMGDLEHGLRESDRMGLMSLLCH